MPHHFKVKGGDNLYRGEGTAGVAAAGFTGHGDYVAAYLFGDRL
jgi:hypothetical protein